jgi:hypothetical protein
MEIWQEWRALYVWIYEYLYFSEFFLAWEMFRVEVVDKIREGGGKPVFYVQLFPRKSWRLWDNVEKCGRVRQATDDNDTTHVLCMLDK